MKKETSITDKTKAMQYEPLLATVLVKCKEGTVVAFKCIKTNTWYTGYIQSLYAPNSKYNKATVWKFDICLNVPISPQWYEDDDKTVYYNEDISNLMILENGC